MVTTRWRGHPTVYGVGLCDERGVGSACPLPENGGAKRPILIIILSGYMPLYAFCRDVAAWREVTWPFAFKRWSTVVARM